MENSPQSDFKIKVNVASAIAMVWAKFNTAFDIINWNYASDEWHTTHAENELKEGGSFNYRMEAKDGSIGFDFKAVYDKIINHKLINYTMDDGRKVSNIFTGDENETTIQQTIEPEKMNPVELQKQGWQAILDNFKKYVETSSSNDIKPIPLL